MILEKGLFQIRKIEINDEDITTISILQHMEIRFFLGWWKVNFAL